MTAVRPPVRAAVPRALHGWRGPWASCPRGHPQRGLCSTRGVSVRRTGSRPAVSLPSVTPVVCVTSWQSHVTSLSFKQLPRANATLVPCEVAAGDAAAEPGEGRASSRRRPSCVCRLERKSFRSGDDSGGSSRRRRGHGGAADMSEPSRTAGAAPSAGPADRHAGAALAAVTARVCPLEVGCVPRCPPVAPTVLAGGVGWGHSVPKLGLVPHS